MSTIYYKATQPDGTDFYSGKILYAVGKTVKPAPYKGQPELCGPGVLHASDTPGETLVGGSWPCRLFQVTGRPILAEGHKYGFPELRVVRELQAWRALGPNGKAVAKFIAEDCPRVNTARYAAWDAPWNAARYAAWDAARYAAWYAARYAARYAAVNAAVNAAGDASLALVVEDLIAKEQFDTLMKPWRILAEFAKEKKRETATAISGAGSNGRRKRKCGRPDSTR